MIGLMIDALIVAWVLSLFGFDNLVINFAKDTFNKIVTKSQYYIGFVVLGMILGLFGWF